MRPPAYPVTYQPETSPSWLNYCAALSGHTVRDLHRPFRYLELGCGRGYSALVHAAGHPAGRFLAIDRDACAIAESLGVRNVAFQSAAFDTARLQGRFDFIVLHGVYSWVPAETRALLRAMLRAHLAPGGLAYVSYNCLPGWAGELPLRRLLGEFGGVAGIGHAVRRVEALSATAYFKAHPGAARAVRGWSGQPEGYLAQEYLGDACEALWSIDVIDDMAAQSLAWIASATGRDPHEALLIDDETARVIAALDTPRRRTLALDFAVNRSFRRDVFTRGAAARDETSLERMIVECPHDAIADSIVTPRGRIRFHAAFVAALRRVMSGSAQRLGDAVAALGGPRAEVRRNLLWLIAAGVLAPAVPDRAARENAQEMLAKRGIVPAT